MNKNLLTLPALSGFFAFGLISGCQEPRPAELPNILWITSEDNSPFAGCYGDTFATTPNMDKLAADGFLYTHAFANAPVCAPARNTILTGVYASSGGHSHMRSQYPKSDLVQPYPVYLREAGYYCTNNVKEDYNLPGHQTKGIWDESSRTAHYKNRQPGQPFFAVFNSTLSHESSIHRRTPLDQLRHDPAKVTLPPYHPDTPDMRHDWAQYYDKIEDMDAWIGTILKELDESGEAENTIVFYYGDHGGVLARSKRFLYNTGTKVPFIVRIPEKYKYLLPPENRAAGSTG
jgi:N-sulfoglucosamine sulfohydrolase